MMSGAPGNGRGPIRNQRGIVLYTALLLLSLIMAVGVQAIISTQSNFQITSNLRSESVAFYLSEAGIEWSKNEIHQSTAHPPVPLTATQAVSAGTFSVSTLSSAAVSSLLAKIVVRSNGNHGSSSQTIQAELLKRYQLADAALMLRGNADRADLSGDLFSISGMDYDPATAKPIANVAPHAGVSVSAMELRDQLESQLSSSQLGKISGAIAQSEFLPASSVAQLSDGLCAAAHAQATAVPAATSLTVSDQTWGSRAAPELRCINGDAGPGDSMTISNSSGAGLLVVSNADLILDGTFRWEGLIIVTGSNIGFRALDAASAEIFGAVIVNETGSYSEAGPPSVELKGAINILFSRSALAHAASLAPAGTLSSLYRYLPREIIQNYWRLITS